VTKFAARHPGGAKVLQAMNNQPIDAYLSGTNGHESLRHEHSKAAYTILAKYECTSTDQSMNVSVRLV
jgi:hypothetical protein